MLTAIKIRIYPNSKQADSLTKAFGSARWYWNNSLAETQKLYNETGKGLGQYALNARLPLLKKENEWLGETHSQVLQSVSLNLSRSFINFFERRAKYPKFKSKQGKQTIQYPQGVKVVDDCKMYLPKIGHVKAVVHRQLLGQLKTVTVSKDASGKYFASMLREDDLPMPEIKLDGKVLGIDVGLTHLAVTSEGSKFDNQRHIKRAERNLKRKQQSLSRKGKGSKTRNKARILVAKAHEKTANARKDYLHKLSKRLVDENQVIAVEDLHVKGMMKNPNLSKAISDVGWGMLTTMLKYKTASAGKGYIEVNRWFASSKTCSTCLNTQKQMPLNIRNWCCDKCGAKHDRDINAAINIRNEAQRMISAGTAVTANGGAVSRERGRKSSIKQAPLKLEAPSFRTG